MHAVALVDAPWREPVEALSAFADEPWAIGFVTGGADDGWSYLAREPDRTLVIEPQAPVDAFAALAELAGPPAAVSAGGPPFQGGVAGLLSYELGDRIERLGLRRAGDWPDLACACYPAVLAFDHAQHRLVAVGRGRGPEAAQARAERALTWLDLPAQAPAPMACRLAADDPDHYEAAVAQVRGRIAAGEIFQANIARRWRGALGVGARPFDLFARLARTSPAPFASYLRLPGAAVVSNSPERFVRVTPQAGRMMVETRPIKGTARRGADAAEDAALAAALQDSAKDRAENLMIVDLMRNDLARVCPAGEVAAPELFRVETFANVHHLVSTVTGELAPGRSAVDLLRAAFPPGSISGAPKIQAIKVIAGLEPPRGPFFGAMFHLGLDGALDSSVLIRTAAFLQLDGGWTVEARAGAGLVADSDPAAERRETEAKIAALLQALGD